MSYETYRSQVMAIVIQASAASAADPGNSQNHMGDAVAALALGLAKVCAITPDKEARAEFIAKMTKQIEVTADAEAASFAAYMAKHQAPH